MLIKILFIATLFEFSYEIPIESHATSYVSTYIGDSKNVQTDDNSELDHNLVHLSAPVISNHVVPISVHKTITPIIKKVPVLIKYEKENYEQELHVEDEHDPAKYDFHYAVEDKHTGDIKSQKESRVGDKVSGEYALKEADGTTRIVKYSADKKSGFNAVVIRSGHSAHPQVEHNKYEIKTVEVPTKPDFIPIVEHQEDDLHILPHY